MNSLIISLNLYCVTQPFLYQSPESNTLILSVPVFYTFGCKNQTHLENQVKMQTVQINLYCGTFDTNLYAKQINSHKRGTLFSDKNASWVFPDNIICDLLDTLLSIAYNCHTTTALNINDRKLFV